MLRPLRLTPFEEYMLVDDQPAYPMSCFFKIKLQGKFDVAVFTSALHDTLPSHPLLGSVVMETNGRYFWRNTETMPVAARLPLETERCFPVSQGINLFHEPALKVSVCNANTNPAEGHLEGQTNLIFEVHHSASDAAGTARFIEDVLCSYAQQTDFADTRTTIQRASVDPDLLRHRGIFRHNILRSMPKQFWGIFRAWKFLLNRVVPLTSEKLVDHQELSSNYPTILCRELTEEETQHVKQKAKQLGMTINDFFLCSTFLMMTKWRKEHVRNPKKGTLRIAVPVNLRTLADERMPAANVVSMVFLDRKPEKIQPTSSFYRGIHNEMQHIKRCGLGWTFIRGLTLYRRVFGNFRKMMRPDRCWATATVSNLGRLFADVPLPRRGGRVQIGDSLELIGVEALPPVRSSTALGISVMTYADCLVINLHYDSAVLTRSDAQSMLQDLWEVPCKDWV